MYIVRCIINYKMCITIIIKVMSTYDGWGGVRLHLYPPLSIINVCMFFSKLSMFITVITYPCCNLLLDALLQNYLRGIM